MKDINLKDKLLDLAVVMMGIWLALGVNSWYDARKEDQLEQKYLQTMHQEVVTDIDDLNSASEFTNKQHKALLEVLRFIREKDTTKLDSIVNHTIHFGNFRAFIPHNTVYRALMESGEINIIKDFGLREGLGQLHLHSYEMTKNAEQTYLDFYLNLLAFMTTHFNYLTREVINEKDFYGIEFTNLVVALQSATQQKLVHYNAAMEKAKEVKDQLEELSE